MNEPTGGASASGPIGPASGPTSAPTGSTPSGDDPTAARDKRRETRRQGRDGTGPLVAGVVLILIGGYFLVRTYLPAIDVDRAWPIILIAIGIVLLLRSVRGSGGPAT